MYNIYLDGFYIGTAELTKEEIRNAESEGFAIRTYEGRIKLWQKQLGNRF